MACRGGRAAPVHVTITSGHNTNCTFVNVFVPAGSISLSKITSGATGTRVVRDRPADRPGGAVPPARHDRTEGVPADATPGLAERCDRPPPSRPLRDRRAVAAERHADGWSLDAVVCNGELVPFDRGGIEVTLTRRAPERPLRLQRQLQLAPRAAAAAAPGPADAADRRPRRRRRPRRPRRRLPRRPSRSRPYPMSDLTVAKHALTPVVPAGQVAAYVLTVRNVGQDAAERVVLADKPRADATIVSVRPSSGSCQVTNMQGPLIVCSLGNLEAGAHASVVVRMIPKTTRASSSTSRSSAARPTTTRSPTTALARSSGSCTRRRRRSSARRRAAARPRRLLIAAVTAAGRRSELDGQRQRAGRRIGEQLGVQDVGEQLQPVDDPRSRT